MLKKQTKKVAVLGSGSWGTALAHVIADAGNSVCIWSRDTETVNAIHSRQENPKYLPGIPLNAHIRASTDLEEVIQAAHWILCAIPTQQIRSALSAYTGILNGTPLINASKGLEMRTHKKVSEIFKELCPKSPYAILSGPSFALEVAKRLPTAVTLACKDKKLGKDAQALFSAPYFRTYTSEDVVGVEISGALKNVIAIASGAVSGLGFGYNSQAALINRGMVEIHRVGKALGAQTLTFLGLAGIGDLVLTCTGPLSRNRRLGEGLARGRSLELIQNEMGGVVEGVFTTQSVQELARHHKLDLPIMSQVYEVLYAGKTAQQALTHLMSRELKDEWEDK